MHYILVPGTWSQYDDKAWWIDNSPLRTYLAKQGISTSVFGWSTKLDGVIGENNHWLIAGRKLADTLRVQAPVDINILAHSHGCQVAWYALGLNGLVTNRLVTVAGPIRKEMAVWRSLANIRSQQWSHIHGSSEDIWQWLGSLFDGSIKFTRSAPEADINRKIEGASHGNESGGLLDVNVWEQHKLVEMLL